MIKVVADIKNPNAFGIYIYTPRVGLFNISFLVVMGRGGVMPQTTPNLLRSDVSSNQISSSENTEEVERQSSFLYIQGSG